MKDTLGIRLELAAARASILDDENITPEKKTELLLKWEQDVRNKLGQEEADRTLKRVYAGEFTPYQKRMNEEYHFVSATCIGETCAMCRELAATHKVGEEIAPDDPHRVRHEYTQYVCCECFKNIFGSHPHKRKEE